MGKYIYQGHMGGLYTTSVMQDSASLYCDECGDSDTLIGYADNFQEAWNLLKSETDMFDSDKCVGCSHYEDYDYCNEHCENYALSGGYSLSWVMGFLHNEFPNDVKWHYVYLLIRHGEGENAYYLVKCDHDKEHFGSVHSFPVAVCSDAEYVKRIADSLMVYGGQIDSSSLKSVSTKHTRDSVIHIYECVDMKPESKNWKDAAFYLGDSWYGYFEKEKINLIEKQELIFCDIFSKN